VAQARERQEDPACTTSNTTPRTKEIKLTGAVFGAMHRTSRIGQRSLAKLAWLTGLGILVASLFLVFMLA